MNLLSFFSVLLVALVSSASSTDNQAQTELTLSNFDEKTKLLSGGKNSGDWTIEFYTKGCSHCRAFEDTWNQFAEKMKDVKRVKIGRVDCSKERDLCRQMNVNSWPTVRFFDKGDDKMFTFSGPRTLERLANFALKEEERNAVDSANIPKVS